MTNATAARMHAVDMTVRIRRRWIFEAGKHVAGLVMAVHARFGLWLGVQAFNAMRVEYRIDGGRWRTVPGPYAVQEGSE
jgi:hypothetical protein